MRLRGILILGLGLVSISNASAEDLVPANGRWVRPAEAAALAEKARQSAGAPAFGTDSTSRLTLGPCDAVTRQPDQPFVASNCEILTPVLSDSAATTGAGFPVHLPTGALITSVTVNYFDNADGIDPGMGLFATASDATQQPVVLMAIGPGNGGLLSKTVAVDPPYQVDNAQTLSFLVIVQSADETHYEGFINAAIDYRLQVSPAPGAATFGDVPTDHPFFQFIEALAASGITAGCGGGNYCPDNSVTRGQMAVFFAKALGLHFPN